MILYVLAIVLTHFPYNLSKARLKIDRKRIVNEKNKKGKGEKEVTKNHTK